MVTLEGLMKLVCLGRASYVPSIPTGITGQPVARPRIATPSLASPMFPSLDL